MPIINAIIKGSGSAPDIGVPREITQTGVYQVPSTTTDWTLPSDVTEIANYALSYALAKGTGTTTVNLANTTTIGEYGCANMCYQHSGLTEFYANELDIVGNDGMYGAFQLCTNLYAVGLGVRVAANRAFSSAFGGCDSLFAIGFSLLEDVGTRSFYYAFDGSGLQTARFPSLASMTDTNSFSYAFINCHSLEDIYFDGLTTSSFGFYNNQLSNMFNAYSGDYSGGVTVHFPSNLQTTISGLSGYPTFGGDSQLITLDFDLDPTE